MSEELIYVNGNYLQVNSVKKQIDETIEKITGIVPDDLKSLEELRIAINDLQHIVQDNSNNINAAIEKGRELVKRDLFIAAGALFNDTNAPITRTAPWGESVQHLAGHYYLNGLGDITEKQMMVIYNEGKWWQSESVQGFGSGNTQKARTYLSPSSYIETYYKKFNFTQAMNYSGIEVLVLVSTEVDAERYPIKMSGVSYFTQGCSKLRRVYGIIDVGGITASVSTINGAPLEEITIKGLKMSLRMQKASALSKASLMYMIANANPTSAITISLHPDAYARLAEDYDIITALEAQPLITLAFE